MLFLFLGLCLRLNHRMALAKVSLQDQKDIEKYTKHLIFKFIQVVLQSRNGIKANHPSRIFPSKTDWFNLTIPDLPEITAETKSAFGRHSMDLSRPVCIEISLRTTDEETMILEYWWVTNTNKTSQVELGYRASSLVYNCIGTFLRSLLIATRSTPAYHLSRNQSTSSYRIQHKILFVEPVYCVEGDFQKHLVATVPSPLGDLNLFVAYKTKLLMCPRKTADLTSDIKDDYFNAEMILPTGPRDEKHSPSEQNPAGVQNPSINATKVDIGQKPKRAAFGPQLQTDVSCDITEDVPFSLLLQHATSSPINSRRKRCESESCDQSTKQKDEGIEIVIGGQSMQQSGDSIHSISSCSSAKETAVKDDFVMVDLKPPFAGQDEDLSQLFRKMLDVPSLSIFEEPSSYADTVNYLEDQLAHFEAMAPEFTDFVTSIQAHDY